MRTRLLVTAFALTASAAACSNEDPPAVPVCAEYTVPASFDPAQPVVSFTQDVVPIFVQSCAFASCHGRASGPAAGLDLRLDATSGADRIAQVREGLVGKPSSELANMPLVTANDPKRSWLMRKLDGDHCLSDSACQGGDCGEAMPRTGQLLSVANRDTIRRWILQGAPND